MPVTHRLFCFAAAHCLHQDFRERLGSWRSACTPMGPRTQPKAQGTNPRVGLRAGARQLHLHRYQASAYLGEAHEVELHHISSWSERMTTCEIRCATHRLNQRPKPDKLPVGVFEQARGRLGLRGPALARRDLCPRCVGAAASAGCHRHHHASPAAVSGPSTAPDPGDLLPDLLVAHAPAQRYRHDG